MFSFPVRIILVSIVLLIAGASLQILLNDVLDQKAPSEEFEDNDVVLITVDSLRSDYIDCETSFEETPNICGLRNESSSFRNSYSHASYTTAAMSAVMTGRYPWNIDMLDVRSSELPEDVDTLAEVLEKKGYRNYGYHEIGSVGPDYGFYRGFYQYKSLRNREGNELLEEEDVDVGLLEAARNDGKSSFVYYHLFGPHQPFRVGKGCENFSQRLKETPWRGRSGVKPSYREDFSKNKAERCYREAVRLSDSRVGDIVGRLKENDQYNESLIIFTADHGEGLWDNRIFGHSQAVYEEQIDIPIYIKLPETASDIHGGNEISEGYARHIDIYPTVLDYLGIEDDFSDLPGKSLLPVIRGNKVLDTVSVKATSKNDRGMITEGFKMIGFVKDPQNFSENRYEYFENVTGNKSEIQREEVPQRYLDLFKTGIEGIEIRNSEESQEEKHDEELMDRLEELGYVS